MNAAVAAHGIHRNNVRVLQRGGSASLIAEALQLPWVQRGSEGQHLQRHPAIQTELLRFVNNTHSATADLSKQPKIANLSQEPANRTPLPILRENSPDLIGYGAQEVQPIKIPYQ